MSVNSSDSVRPPPPPYFTVDLQCIISTPGSFIFTMHGYATILILLPLCVFILHHGLRQWRQKRSSSSSSSSVSHSDSLTYHAVVMELVRIFACVLACCGVYRRDLILTFAGSTLFNFTWDAETLFHVLTCVERYLAVVHPITYLGLRNQRGTRIRNISVACVWLICLVWTSLIIKEKIYMFVNLCMMILSLMITSFCSLSVLRVLIRPGPGEQGGGRGRVDQTKLRAFNTIVVILGLLVLRFIWGLVWVVMYMSRDQDECVLITCAYWFTLPSSLVLPLMFLHRAGKLVCCKKS